MSPTRSTAPALGMAGLVTAVIALVLVLLQAADRTHASFSEATSADFTVAAADPGRWQLVSFLHDSYAGRGLIRFNDEQTQYRQGGEWVTLLDCADDSPVSLADSTFVRFADPVRSGDVRLISTDGAVYQPRSTSSGICVDQSAAP